MKAILQTHNLQRGMFVAELDRPWLETPFLLQGFLIESDNQIEELQKYCRSVLVDRRRSVGVHQIFERAKATAKPRRTSAAFQHPDEAQPDDFAAICRLLRQQRSGRRHPKPPKVDPLEGQSRLEAELLYSAPIFDDVIQALGLVGKALSLGEVADLQQVIPLVRELAEGVERNPEAMLWLTRLKSTDQYSYNHAVDVSVHLMVFARFLGMSTPEIEQIGLAGLLQDLGKIYIPARILNKPDRLDPEELALIRSHVAASLEMLIASRGVTVDMLKIVAAHHERHDGSGYPRGLKGEAIGLQAQMAGLVDCFCAMIRERPYELAISCQAALETLIKLRDSQFRTTIVDQFIQCIGIYPIGTLVELNSGEVGVVIQQNQVRRLKPRILLVLGPDKSFERNPRTIDLIMEPHTPTGQPYRILKSLPPNAHGINPEDLYLA